jgi:hypothetical protein
MFKKLLLIGLLSLGLYSCDDALEITQDGELNDKTLFQSVANMQLFLNETYDRVSVQSDILVSSLLTDEVGLGSAGFSNDTHRFFIFSTNGFASSIWNQHYQAINYANRLIRGAENVTPAPSEVAAYNNILAQARAIRAFAHFQLLTYYSTDLSNDNAPGVMKLDFVPTAQEKVQRSTNGEVFALIESDLLFAENNLTTATTGADSWTFFNKNSVNALRARMYLYRKNYVLAEQYANLVITGPNAPTLASCAFTNSTNIPATSAFTPIPVTNPFSAGQSSALTSMEGVSATAANSPAYRRMWTDQIQGEIVLSLKRATNNANFGSQYNTNQSNLSGGPLFDMSRNLYGAYSQPLGGISIPNLTGGSSSGTTITVTSTSGLLVNMDLTLSSGTGSFAPNTVVTSIINTTQFTVNQAPTSALVGATITATLSAQDFRRWSFVDRTSTFQANPLTATKANEVIVIDKYPGKTGNAGSNDLKIFRISEMYFIKAECRVRANDLPGAAAAIQLVRQARNYVASATVPTPVYSSNTNALSDILLERRKELAFEGHRYIDLKRLGIEAGVTVTDRYSQDAVNASALSPANINVTDYRFTLPIPQNELNVNPMLQNPGY